MPPPPSHEDVDIRTLMAGFPSGWRPLAAVPLPTASGFSGSRIWRITCPLGEAALRRWPVETSTRRVQALHGLLATAIRAGQGHLPAPIGRSNGETVWEARGRLWELATWRPGDPLAAGGASLDALTAAMTALAQWHGALTPARIGPIAPELADRATVEAFLHSRPCPSPAFQRRADEWRRLRPRLDPGLATMANDPLALARRTESIARALEPRIDSWTRRGLQPIVPRVCLGDVRRAHVLFRDGMVTGIVDFEAVTLDTVARDLGRYLGEVAPDDPELRRAARQAHASLVGVDPAEDALAEILDTFGCLVASLRWFDWIFRPRPDSPDPVAGYGRWSEVVSRLEQVVRRSELP